MLLQVEKSFEYLTQYHSEMESYVKFNISCGNEGQKGIHRRNVMDDKTMDSSVTVEPVFLNSTDVCKYNILYHSMLSLLLLIVNARNQNI